MRIKNNFNRKLKKKENKNNTQQFAALSHELNTNFHIFVFRKAQKNYIFDSKKTKTEIYIKQ